MILNITAKEVFLLLHHCANRSQRKRMSQMTDAYVNYKLMQEQYKNGIRVFWYFDIHK